MAQKPPIEWIPSPHFGYPPGTHGRCGQKPLAIVHHIAEGTLTGTDSHFQNPASKASTQFMVGKSGEIHQYVDTDDAAWGNGGLNEPDMSVPWIAECVRKGISPNLVTISVEYEGRHSDDPSGRYHFTEAQIAAGIALDAYLCEQYAIAPSFETINGHFQLDSVTRAFCPGPNFPFERFITALQSPAKPAPTVKLPNGTVLPASLPGDALLGPVRAIAEGLGYSVQWDAAAQQAIIGRLIRPGTPIPETPIPVYVNGGDGKVRGRTLQGTVRDGTTYVTINGLELPLRPVAVTLGCTVEYVGKESGGPAVTVTSLKPSDPPPKRCMCCDGNNVNAPCTCVK